MLAYEANIAFRNSLPKFYAGGEYQLYCGCLRESRKVGFHWLNTPVLDRFIPNGAVEW